MLFWKAVRIGVSCVLALVAIVSGAYLAETYNLPFFHAWALIHGMFFVLYPVYCVIFFWLLGPVFRRVIPSQGGLPERRLSTAALLSVVLSSIGFLIPPIALGGVITGHIARSRCKADPTTAGSGVALLGLILGYSWLAYWVYAVVKVLWAVRMAGG